MKREDVHAVVTHMVGYARWVSSHGYVENKLDPEACACVVAALERYGSDVFNGDPSEKVTSDIPRIVSVTVGRIEK